MFWRRSVILNSFRAITNEQAGTPMVEPIAMCDTYPSLIKIKLLKTWHTGSPISHHTSNFTVLLSDHTNSLIAVVRLMTMTQMANDMTPTFRDLRVKPVKRESKASMQATRFATGARGYVGSMSDSWNCTRCTELYIVSGDQHFQGSITKKSRRPLFIGWQAFEWLELVELCSQVHWTWDRGFEDETVLHVVFRTPSIVSIHPNGESIDSSILLGPDYTFVRRKIVSRSWSAILQVFRHNRCSMVDR